MFGKKKIKYDYSVIHNRINVKILDFCDLLKTHPLYETNKVFRSFAISFIWDGENIVRQWTPECSYAGRYEFGSPVYGYDLYNQYAWEKWEETVNERIEFYTKRVEEYTEWCKKPNDFDIRDAKFVKFKANPLGTTTDHYMYLFGARMCNEDNGWLFFGLDNGPGCQIDTTFASRDEYEFVPMTTDDFVIFLKQERIRLEKAGKLITEMDEELNKLIKEFEKQKKRFEK